MNIFQTNLLLKDKCLSFEYYRSSGPGGQNTNKLSTAVRLRFDILTTTFLSEDAKVRLTGLAGSKLTNSGVLLIEVQSFRTQNQNRKLALRKLINLLLEAKREPRARIATQPPIISKKRRLESKKHYAIIKKKRSPVTLGE